MGTDRSCALLFAVLVAGCSCDGPVAETPTATTESATALSTEPEAAPEPTPATRPEPPPPPAESARAFVTGLREARRVSHDGDAAAAFALFQPLVAARPESVRLRCEAGYVAFRAGRLEEAEAMVSNAIARWARPIRAADRVPFAMCLYNRGLIARDRGDLTAAAEAWRESLTFRPNATVERALAALDVPTADEPTGDDGEPCARDPLLAATAAELSVPLTDFDETVSAASGRTAVLARFAAESDDSGETTIHVLYVTEGNCTRELDVRAEEYRMWSYYDDHVEVGAPVFHDGGPAGEMLTLTIGNWGRGDDDDGRPVAGGETRLYVCAARAEWRCEEMVIESYSSTDCEAAGGCDDPDDPSDDADGLPTETSSGYHLQWEITAEGALVIGRGDSPDDVADDEVGAPMGRTPLIDLFGIE